MSKRSFTVVAYTRDGGWECDYPLKGVLRFIETQKEDRVNCDLNPDFQREHVWTRKQQAAWLIHYLRGGKNGRRLFFNHPGWSTSYKGDLVLVDGKQRLEAIGAFLNNELPLWGMTYRQMCPTKDAERYLMSRNTMRINVNTLKTRGEVLQWYLEMNGGGTPHTEAELQKVRNMLSTEGELTEDA